MLYCAQAVERMEIQSIMAEKQANIKWVTHAGKHIPLKVDEKSAKSDKATAGTTATSGAGGINGKKQLSKIDKLNNLKGPKTKKK